MPLGTHDLAILTARFGAARFGASRFGFIPCPEDVHGVGTDEPGEYVWKEDTPPSQETPTEWTLASEDCVCRQLCTLALGAISLSDPTPVEDVDVTASVTLSGVLGLVEGIARINWGDGRHDQQDFTQLGNGVLEFDGHYHVPGSYTITITVTDERGCDVEATLPVTVDPAFSVTVAAAQGPCVQGGEAEVPFVYTVIGGTGPYTYSLSWTGGGGGGPDTNLDPTITFTGNPGDPETIPYTLVVTDALLATANFSDTVDVVYCLV